ncbi:hypothetical protein PHMEG_00039911, partial [Phytophthora megakarya]
MTTATMRDERAERRAASQERVAAASKAKTQTPRLTLDTDDERERDKKKMTTATMRDERAERRAASQERVAAASKAKTQTPRLTLDTDDGGSLILDSAEIQSSTGQTPLGSMIQRELEQLENEGARGNAGVDGDGRVSGNGAGHGGNGGSAGAGEDDTGHGRNPPRQPQQRYAVSTAGGRHQAEMAGLGEGHGDAGTGHVPPPPPPAPMTSMMSGTTPPGVTQQIVFREEPKSLKLTKFKGLDDSMPVTMWKTVRAEVRRQAVTSGVVWQEKQLYHEVAAHLEGEAKRWFATVMESVPEDQESINTLADMLRTKYMGQRTGPELVDLLNERR